MISSKQAKVPEQINNMKYSQTQSPVWTVKTCDIHMQFDSTDQAMLKFQRHPNPEYNKPLT